jgi:hypothetical protein
MHCGDDFYIPNPSIWARKMEKRNPGALLLPFIIFVVAIIFLFSLLTGIPHNSSPRLYECGDSIMTAIQSKNVITDLSNFNSSSIKELINDTPENICISLYVSKDDTAFYYADTRYRENCSEIVAPPMLEMNDTISHAGIQYGLCLRLTDSLA